MKDRILYGWTFPRWTYLILGILLVVHAIGNKTWPGILFGTYFAAMAIFRFGCAGGFCYNKFTQPDSSVVTRNKKDEIEYQEIK